MSHSSACLCAHVDVVWMCPCAGARKSRRGSQAKQGNDAAAEQTEDDAEYADQNEDSSNVPSAGPRGQKHGKGRRCGCVHTN